MPSRRSCQCHGGINATSASSSGFRAECRSAVSASQCECLCLSVSHHLQSQDSEDAEAHKITSAQSEATDECQDSSRRFSLQELIEDDAAVDGEKHAATGGHEEDPAADAVVHGVAEAAAAGPPEQAAGRRVIIGMMRRYVRVRPIKTKRAPEKNVAPIC